jgi:nickel-dependent lactate racemase
MPPGGSSFLRYGRGQLELPSTRFRLDPVESIGPAEPPSELSEDALEKSVHRLALSLVGKSTAGRSSLLIVVSDGSRRTAVQRYLPRLLAVLGDRGRLDIRFLVATGLHRKPSSEEIRTILGDDTASRFQVYFHDPDHRDRLVELGTTRRGTVVEVNRHLLEHDQVLLTGAVGWHYHAGFSGGRKSLVPGLAGRKTIVGNHLKTLQADGSRHPDSRAGALAGNPVHEDMLEAASMFPPPMIVNTVLDPSGSLEGIWTGGMVQAHEAACDYLLRTRSIRLVPRDLVVVGAGGHPTDINLIQAHKAFEAAYPAVTPGGTVILAAACPEGLGDDEFRQGVLAGSESELAASLLADYRVYGQTALAWRRKLAECRLILVSEIPAELVRKTGAEPASSLAAALEMAAAGWDGGERGWLFGQGSRWLVTADGDRV